MGSLKLGNVWVFVQLIHRPSGTKISCTKTQTLFNLRLPISSVYWCMCQKKNSDYAGVIQFWWVAYLNTGCPIWSETCVWLTWLFRVPVLVVQIGVEWAGRQNGGSYKLIILSQLNRSLRPDGTPCIEKYTFEPLHFSGSHNEKPGLGSVPAWGLETSECCPVSSCAIPTISVCNCHSETAEEKEDIRHWLDNPFGTI